MPARRNSFQHLTASLLCGVVLLAACNQVLGIRDYQLKPSTGGNGAEPAVSGTGGAGEGGRAGSNGGRAGGDGGEPGSGGSLTGTAGSNSAAESGGTAGSQAATAGAGEAGEAGQAGQGGAPAGGGTAGSGGTAGAQAGSGGGGGTAGVTSNPCGFTPNYFTFETSSTEGFEVTYFEPQLLRNSSSITSENGSLVLRIGFDGEQQEYDVASLFEEPLDLEGKVVSACVRLVDNVEDSEHLPAIELYASSGENQDEGYSYEKRFSNTDWFKLELIADLPSRQDGLYDASVTSSIGFAVWTDFGYYGAVEIEIDGVSVE
jgi:hypothetical protein